jgi:hypothetical protein
MPIACSRQAVLADRPQPVLGWRTKARREFHHSGGGQRHRPAGTDDPVFGLGFALEEQANLAWIASSRGPPCPIKKDRQWLGEQE